ncbi:unnamed protein product [Ectocarpus sp. 8 AP-2014]
MSNINEYGDIGVHGNIIASSIHHLFYGQYSFRAIIGLITGNTFHDHVAYCTDPHHASINMTISHNEMFNCGNHGIIISKFCDNAKLLETMYTTMLALACSPTLFPRTLRREEYRRE